MKLLELCDPLFQYVCRINRLGRAGADIPAEQIRTEVSSILAQIKSNAAADSGLLAQYEMKEGRDGKKGIELVLMFFADFMIRESNLPCARQWNDLAPDYEEYAGDDKFFELLDETLADSSPQATEQLAVYYTCMGLGFTGGYAGQDDVVQRKMRDCALRINEYMDPSDTEKICREAYGYTDRRELNLPATGRVMKYVAIFTMILLGVFVLAGFGYHAAKQQLSNSLTSIEQELSKNHSVEGGGR